MSSNGNYLDVITQTEMLNGSKVVFFLLSSGPLALPDVERQCRGDNEERPLALPDSVEEAMKRGLLHCQTV